MSKGKAKEFIVTKQWEYARGLDYKNARACVEEAEAAALRVAFNDPAMRAVSRCVEPPHFIGRTTRSCTYAAHLERRHNHEGV